MSEDSSFEQEATAPWHDAQKFMIYNHKDFALFCVYTKLWGERYIRVPGYAGAYTADQLEDLGWQVLPPLLERTERKEGGYRGR